MRFLFVLALLVATVATGASAREFRIGQESARIGDTTLAVYTYRPLGCRLRALLFVFHGVDRNPSDYRDNARPLADRLCFEVIAPLFDDKRFPGWRYQRGGIVRKKTVQPSGQWAVTMVAGLVAWGRQRVGGPAMPYYLFGHSAGAQFLSRVAAFAPPPSAARIVIANASSHVMPSLEEMAPFGLGEAFPRPEAEAHLKAYLALPVTIYLGEADTGQKHLSTHPAARRQGANRFERGRAVYRAAVDAARQKGWPFNWKLVTVPQTGHSARRMLSAQQVDAAFGLLP